MKIHVLVIIDTFSLWHVWVMFYRVFITDGQMWTVSNHSCLWCLLNMLISLPDYTVFSCGDTWQEECDTFNLTFITPVSFTGYKKTWPSGAHNIRIYCQHCKIDGSFIRQRTNLEVGPQPTNRFDVGDNTTYSTLLLESFKMSLALCLRLKIISEYVKEIDLKVKMHQNLHWKMSSGVTKLFFFNLVQHMKMIFKLD